MPPPRPAARDDHGGLHRDLPRAVDRRRLLGLAGGLGAAGLLAACSPGDDGASSTSSTTSTTSTTSTAGGASTSVAAGAGAEIPEETQGPFPADGSNGPNVVADGAVVRSDVTSSFGDLDGVADGVPATLRLAVVDAGTGDALPGAAVYIWHCTADGRYSIYEVRDQNYLRGVQVADEAGRVTFATVFPGCYPGRWPHVHFEVYESLDAAASGTRAVKTSQLALPRADARAVFADDRYGDSAANLARLSLEGDMVFADGWSDQLATVDGSSGEGYSVSLLVRV